MIESVLIVLMVVLYILSRPIEVRRDRERIRKHVLKQGGEVLEVRRSVFGKGWAYTRERIYRVYYKDVDGNLHAGTCKTNPLLGVYWTEDRVTCLGKPTATLRPEDHERVAADLKCGSENEAQDASPPEMSPIPSPDDEEPSFWTL